MFRPLFVFFKVNKIKIIAFIFLLSIVPFFIPERKVVHHDAQDNELFKKELSYLNSTEKVINYLDTVYGLNNCGNFDTSVYVQAASKLVKERFHYGLSRYSVSDNWIASLSGNLVWSHFSAIVDPNDLLKHSDGLCSQQTMVFLEILRMKGIPFRTVGLGYEEGPGHFLSEVRYNGEWHLHDVTKEPQWSKIVNHHFRLDYYLEHRDSLFIAYEGKISRPVFDKLLEKVEYGEINEFPAKNMLLFHQVSKIMTYILPLLFLCFLIYKTVN